MIAFVLGATGATGKALVQQLLNDERYTAVHVFVRRQPSVSHPKLQVHLMDFERPSDWTITQAADVAFSCLGTTIKDAGSQAAQRRVDVDYQLQFAAMARRCGVKTFVLLSAMSANPSSRYFYMRIKGEAEEGVKALGFERTLIFRPGMIDRGEQARFGERIGLAGLTVLNRLGLLRRQRPITTEQLAARLIKGQHLEGKGLRIFALSEIHDL